jgi:hypothetical protein
MSFVLPSWDLMQSSTTNVVVLPKYQWAMWFVVEYHFSNLRTNNSKTCIIGELRGVCFIPPLFYNMFVLFVCFVLFCLFYLFVLVFGFFLISLFVCFVLLFIDVTEIRHIKFNKYSAIRPPTTVVFNSAKHEIFHNFAWIKLIKSSPAFWLSYKH